MTSELTNRAVECQRRILQLTLDERDAQSAINTWASDATLTLHNQSGFVLDKNQAEAWYQQIIDEPDTIDWFMDVVTVRGDLLCLVTLTTSRPGSGFGFDVLVVLEVDDRGHMVRGAQFENEHLRAAHICLIEWFIEGLAPDLAAVASAGLRLNHAVQDGDRAGLDELFADDIVVTDHRPLSYGQTDKHGLLEVWVAVHDESPGTVVLQPTVDRLTPNGIVCTSDAISSNGFVTSGVAVMIFRDGLFTNMEIFEISDLDTALARFDELTTQSP